MTLMRFDPFRELDRLSEHMLAPARMMRPMPMEAYRRGDEFFVEIDMPGVNPEDVDVTVERNVVNIRARRRPSAEEGDEVLVNERMVGEFTRQLFLGENLDPSKLEATFDKGVLKLRIPVAEQSKPRKVQIAAGTGGQQTIETSQAQQQAQTATETANA